MWTAEDGVDSGECSNPALEDDAEGVIGKKALVDGLIAAVSPAPDGKSRIKVSHIP